MRRRLGGRQGLSGRARKISPPPRLDPRTVEPVGSRDTAYAIPAHRFIYNSDFENYLQGCDAMQSGTNSQNFQINTNSSPCLSQMEAACFSRTLNFYQTKRRHIPENNFQTPKCFHLLMLNYSAFLQSASKYMNLASSIRHWRHS